MYVFNIEGLITHLVMYRGGTPGEAHERFNLAPRRSAHAARQLIKASSGQQDSPKGWHQQTPGPWLTYWKPAAKTSLKHEASLGHSPDGNA